LSVKAPVPRRSAAAGFVLVGFLLLTPFLTAQNVVDLSWSGDSGQISGYNVYRSNVSGGPYSKLNSNLDTETTYTDSAVLPSHTYYYVTTAVNSQGQESGYSNETQASLPGHQGGGNEQLLYVFGQEGMEGPVLPEAGLTFDKAGNLYGTSKTGGAYNQGTVFELAMGSNGWVQTVLYSFTGGGDGGQPTAEITFDGAGNIYGTTSAGGSGSCSSGCGTVFELAPSSGGWAETVLYSFTGGTDGAQPYAALVMDPSGNVYGTAAAGGNIGSNCSSGCGVVFKLAPASGSWTQSVLYSFAGGSDGSSPLSALILDPSGNLYGTTYSGGSYGKGTVFEVSNTANGWTESVLRTFTGASDGASPVGGLVFDSAGNLYGTTFQGGANGYGVAFELSPIGQGSWREKVIHGFGNTPSANPAATLIFDPAGDLYGTTLQGATLTSCGGGCGTLFKLTPNSKGFWAFAAPHLFGRGEDGYHPNGRLVMDASGNLYGTTQAGGAQNAGAVFEITP
jgi:uncharacterized repeat protein (TIGR03803 family)